MQRSPITMLMCIYIITPGENHYGAYVATGNIKTDRKYTIYFMALPSKDWGSKTAYLKLNFDRHKLTFTQTMVLFNNTSKVPDEYGKYKILINKVANPVSLKWPAKK
jgi:hypothetical protein